MLIDFDQVSKAVATGVSRRQALKVIGSAFGGTILATTVGVESTEAAPNKCAVYCGKTSFSSGPAHAACLQACHECKGDVSRVCQFATTAVCCASGSSCCPDSSGGGTCCPPGTFCNGAGACVQARSFCVPTCADTCAGTATGCSQACAGGSTGCSCVSTVEGSACVQQVCTFTVCTNSTDCGPGAVCFTQGCCGP